MNKDYYAPPKNTQELVDGINYINGVIWGFAASSKDGAFAASIATQCQDLLKETSDTLIELEQKLKEANQSRKPQ